MVQYSFLFNLPYVWYCLISELVKSCKTGVYTCEYVFYTCEYVFHTSVYVFNTSEYVFFEYVFYTGVSLCGIDCGEGNTVLCTPERRSREECIEYGIGQSRIQ